MKGMACAGMQMDLIAHCKLDNLFNLVRGSSAQRQDTWKWAEPFPPHFLNNVETSEFTFCKHIGLTNGKVTAQCILKCSDSPVKMIVNITEIPSRGKKRGLREVWLH